MSSKILRDVSASSVSPLAFRPANGSGAALQTSRAHSHNVRHAPASSQDIETLLEQARREARAEGEAIGASKAAAALEQAFQSFGQLIHDLAGQRQRLRSEAEQDTVKLAIAIARRVIHRELTIDPEAMLGLIHAAFAKLNARETHRLRVSEPDADLIQRHRDSLNLPPAVEVVAESSLPPGSAIFETARGELDASVGTQLAEIDRGLTDLLRRQSR
jgi:flagellar assembly protein FliH